MSDENKSETKSLLFLIINGYKFIIITIIIESWWYHTVLWLFLSLSVPIFHRSWQILKTKTSVCTELMHVFTDGQDVT